MEQLQATELPMHDSSSPSVEFSDPCFIRVSSVAQNRLVLIRPIVGGEKRSQMGDEDPLGPGCNTVGTRMSRKTLLSGGLRYAYPLYRRAIA